MNNTELQTALARDPLSGIAVTGQRVVALNWER